MMGDSKNSCSREQLDAEKDAFQWVQRHIASDLKSNPKIFLKDNGITCICPDFYSETECIIGEIFAHLGAPKKAQDNKIANDILKMLLLEKVKGKTYRKILVVCDEVEQKKLTGESALAESIRQFGVEVYRAEITEERRRELEAAQKRQEMTNA
jgi:hypothetical protein